MSLEEELISEMDLTLEPQQKKKEKKDKIASLSVCAAHTTSVVFNETLLRQKHWRPDQNILIETQSIKYMRETVPQLNIQTHKVTVVEHDTKAVIFMHLLLFGWTKDKLLVLSNEPQLMGFFQELWQDTLRKPAIIVCHLNRTFSFTLLMIFGLLK